MNSAVDRAFSMLSNAPLSYLSPTDSGQPILADAAWTHIEVIAAHLSDHPRSANFGDGGKVTRAHYDGLWKWCVYLREAYLRGTLSRLPGVWTKLFFSMEIIFGNFERISPLWQAWIEDTPELLSLLTELWKTQQPISQERVTYTWSGIYRSPVRYLVCSPRRRASFFRQWCDIAGGPIDVAGILLFQLDIFLYDEVRVEGSKQMLLAMSLEDDTCRAALLYRKATATISKYARVVIAGPPTVESLEDCQTYLSTIAVLGSHSVDGLKKAIRGQILSTALTVTLDCSSTPESLQLCMADLFDLVRQNLVHYSILHLAERDLDVIYSRFMCDFHLLSRAPRFQDATIKLLGAMDYRLLLYPKFCSITRILQKQVCGFSECQYSTKLALSKVSQECFESVYGSAPFYADSERISSLFSECASCERISYCSRSCQKKDWKSHKDQCHMVTSRRIQGALKCYALRLPLAHEVSERITPNFPKDSDTKLFQIMNLWDMQRFKGSIGFERQTFQRMNARTSPCLIILELDYTQHRQLDQYAESREQASPFSWRFLKLQDVLICKGHSEQQMAKITYWILIGGERLYTVKYYVGGHGARAIWTIPRQT